MKTRKSILVLVILLLLVFMRGQAGAGFLITGNKLVELMRAFDMAEARSPAKDIRWEDVQEYMGYIAGVVDSLSDVLLNVPIGVTHGQVCAIVAKYLKNHPERWNEPAVYLVTSALQEAFPLKKK